LYKTCLKECQNIENYIDTMPQNTSLVVPFENVIESIEFALALAANVNNYSNIADSYFSSSSKDDPIEKSKRIQTEVHTKLSQVNGTIASKKKDIIEIFTTSDTFYKEKLVSLAGDTRSDNSISSKLLNDRSTLIRSSAKTFLQAIT